MKTSMNVPIASAATSTSTRMRCMWPRNVLAQKHCRRFRGRAQSVAVKVSTWKHHQIKTANAYGAAIRDGWLGGSDARNVEMLCALTSKLRGATSEASNFMKPKTKNPKRSKRPLQRSVVPHRTAKGEPASHVHAGVKYTNGIGNQKIVEMPGFIKIVEFP